MLRIRTLHRNLTLVVLEIPVLNLVVLEIRVLNLLAFEIRVCNFSRRHDIDKLILLTNWHNFFYQRIDILQYWHIVLLIYWFYIDWLIARIIIVNWLVDVWLIDWFQGPRKAGLPMPSVRMRCAQKMSRAHNYQVNVHILVNARTQVYVEYYALLK